MSGVIGGLAQVVAPTNLLGLAALSLLCGQNAPRMPIAALVAFAFGWLVGSVLVALALRDPPAALSLLGFAAIAGLTAAAAWRVPTAIKCALAFATGAALALNSPPQAISIPVAITAQLATGLGALAAFAAVAFVAMQADRECQRIGIRIVGSWIAASAILVLALRVVR